MLSPSCGVMQRNRYNNINNSRACDNEQLDEQRSDRHQRQNGVNNKKYNNFVNQEISHKLQKEEL